MPAPRARGRRDVYVAVQSPAAGVAAFRLASELRRDRRRDAARGAGERSLKAQMRARGRASARAYVAIIGERELRDGSVTLKDLADGTSRRPSPHRGRGR